ncbi:hypothetical protein AAEX28_13840 [Lentisphaerota bacterium WC36G]|nr:hypothetical protein LJT99_00590 [Lentisphaerae bacterium WC36]
MKGINLLDLCIYSNDENKDGLKILKKYPSKCMVNCLNLSSEIIDHLPNKIAMLSIEFDESKRKRNKNKLENDTLDCTELYSYKELDVLCLYNVKVYKGILDLNLLKISELSFAPNVPTKLLLRNGYLVN